MLQLVRTLLIKLFLASKYKLCYFYYYFIIITLQQSTCTHVYAML